MRLGGLHPLAVLDLEGDDYAIVAAVVQRAAIQEAEWAEQVMDALAARIGNAVGKVLGG